MDHDDIEGGGRRRACRDHAPEFRAAVVGGSDTVSTKV
jgi:hypothetical protein